MTPLVEAVGGKNLHLMLKTVTAICLTGYKDYEKSDFTLHTHSEKVLRKTSHLKNMDNESNELSVSDESSPSSERPSKINQVEPLDPTKDEEIFELGES